MPDSTRVTVGYLPQDKIEDFLDPSNTPPKPTEPAPVYARPAPGPHPADAGKDLKVLQPLATELRYVLHDQLTDDLERLGISGESVTLDFSRARQKKGGRSAKAHDGTMCELQTVKVIDETGIFIHQSPVDFVRDKLADELHCWWAGQGIPEQIWLSLDLGVQRRMAADPHFADDPLCAAFREKNAGKG